MTRIEVDLRPIEISSDMTSGGPRGYSAYEIWLQEGNTGSEQDFLESLRGDGVVDGSGLVTLINGQLGKIDPKNLDLGVFTDTTDGLVPKTGTPSGKFLKDDGSWGAPADTAVTIEVVDNLNDTSTTKALSANQGKVLDGKIGTAEASAKSYADTKAGLAETAAKQYTDDSSVANKQYTDDRVKTPVPEGAVFTDTITPVVDNLTSTSATSALSANQGKVLKDDLDNRVKTPVPTNAKFTDTVYTHPASHPASMITESETRRFVSDAEKSAWNAKWDYDASTIQGVKVNNALNADTVNGKTVAVNVPANAKFTDTVTTVVDNLTSTSATSALSAKQGKALNDLIGDIGAALDLINGEVI